MLNAVLSWFWAQDWWIELPVVAAALFAGYMLLAAIGRAILMIVDQLMRWAIQFIHWFSSLLSSGIIAGLRAIGWGVMFVLQLLFRPFLWAYWEIKALISGLLGDLQARLDEQKDLRRLWEEEYRDQYRTFKEFKTAFNSDQGPGPKERQEPHFGGPEFEKPRDPPDPLIEACRLFGLPENGNFTQQDLKAKYRQFIHAAHPDRGGSEYLAGQINDARKLIEKKRGWVT